jgi:predicted enzyme related to lactoylglutathione lyase
LRTSLLALIATVGPVGCVTIEPPVTPATVASAGISTDAVQIGAVDVPDLEKFYKSAFGLKEVDRIPGAVMLNFGETERAAKSNPSPQIVIMHRPHDAKYGIFDTVPHLILAVTDMQPTVSAIEAAGGRINSMHRFGNNGPPIDVVAVDTSGNRLELVQRPTPVTNLATLPSVATPATPAFAGVSLDAVQIAAWNVPLVEKFYQSAFGLNEVDRNPWAVRLDLGEPGQAAKSDPSPQIVITRPSRVIFDVVPHLIFAVTDMQAAVSAIEGAGGCITSMARFGQNGQATLRVILDHRDFCHIDVRQFGKNGLIIGIAADPAGNRLELVQRTEH